jgi:hypothetical protein
MAMEPASALNTIEGIRPAHAEKSCRGGIGTIIRCSGLPIRVALASSAEHREDDLLGVSSLCAKTADVKLVSLLKDYVLGEDIIHAYRLPQAAFPSLLSWAIRLRTEEAASSPAGTGQRR